MLSDDIRRDKDYLNSHGNNYSMSEVMSDMETYIFQAEALETENDMLTRENEDLKEKINYLKALLDENQVNY